MGRELLDLRIRVHNAIATADDAIDRAAARRSRLEWLNNLARARRPLPGTPEWEAENDRIYEGIYREQAGPTRSTGAVDWDGIWRSQ